MPPRVKEGKIIMSKTYEISGMKCQGCANAVTEKLSAVKGVEEVRVDIEKNQVTIEEILEMVLEPSSKRQ